MKEQYKCQSYYDENNTLKDCSCGQCEVKIYGSTEYIEPRNTKIGISEQRMRIYPNQYSTTASNFGVKPTHGNLKDAMKPVTTIADDMHDDAPKTLHYGARPDNLTPAKYRDWLYSELKEVDKKRVCPKCGDKRYAGEFCGGAICMKDED